MENPSVALLMGSDSDWEVMRHCAAQLEELGISAEVHVMSAHRTPDDVVSFVKSAGKRGIMVFIAGAGMSAALAGTIASHTDLPVIGVPLDSGALGGMDALLSTVQMPPGVPVAAMAVGRAGAVNAALFATRIMALRDPELSVKLGAFNKSQAEKMRQKDRDLEAKT